MSMQTTKAAVYAAFKAGERLSAAVISDRANVSRSYLNRVIQAMCADGTLERRRVGNQGAHGGSMEYEYTRACDVIERETVPVSLERAKHRAKVVVVSAPYPRVLINVPAADAQIGRDLWAHARLCMGARGC